MSSFFERNNGFPKHFLQGHVGFSRNPKKKLSLFKYPSALPPLTLLLPLLFNSLSMTYLAYRKSGGVKSMTEGRVICKWTDDDTSKPVSFVKSIKYLRQLKVNNMENGMLILLTGILWVSRAKSFSSQRFFWESENHPLNHINHENSCQQESLFSFLNLL